MEIHEQDIINILSTYINKNKSLSIRSTDWEKIYKPASLHSISPIIYICLNKNKINIDKTVYHKFECDFLTTIKYSTLQEITALQLLHILNENRIKHIIFKGFVLRDYYPDKEARTMGDIDIIIEPHVQEKVHKILLNSGFEFDKTSSKKEVWNYKKNNVLFEIHTEIIKVSITSKTDFEKYFADNFKYAVNIKDHTYEFTKEHHFIYLITHLAKHFKFSGFGIRMLLDIPVFINRFKNELDWENIKKELEILGLCDFTSCILKICNEWFDTNIPNGFDIELTDNDIEAIENYIISGGVFGYNNRNIDAMRINKSNDSFISRAVHMTRLIFPSYEFITRRYVWAANTHKFLLPLTWIRLWYYRVFVMKENSFKRIAEGLKSNEDAVEHSRLMNVLNLK